MSLHFSNYITNYVKTNKIDYIENKSYSIEKESSFFIDFLTKVILEHLILFSNNLRTKSNKKTILVKQSITSVNVLFRNTEFNEIFEKQIKNILQTLTNFEKRKKIFEEQLGDEKITELRENDPNSDLIYNFDSLRQERKQFIDENVNFIIKSPKVNKLISNLTESRVSKYVPLVFSHATNLVIQRLIFSLFDEIDESNRKRNGQIKENSRIRINLGDFMSAIEKNAFLKEIFFNRLNVIVPDSRRKQRTTCVSFALNPFRRLIQNLGRNHLKDIRFSKDSVSILQFYLEDYFGTLFNQANVIANHSGRQTVMRKDIKMTQSLIHDNTRKELNVKIPDDFKQNVRDQIGVKKLKNDIYVELFEISKYEEVNYEIILDELKELINRGKNINIKSVRNLIRDIRFVRDKIFLAEQYSEIFSVLNELRNQKVIEKGLITEEDLLGSGKVTLQNIKNNYPNYIRDDRFSDNEIKRIAKNVGVERLSNDVYGEIRKIQFNKIDEITHLISLLLKNDKRKTVTDNDMSYIIDQIDNINTGGSFRVKRCV